MKKIKTVFALVILTVLIGCSEKGVEPVPPWPSINTLAGTQWIVWDAGFTVITFKEDGETFLESSDVGDYQGTYFIEGDKITILSSSLRFYQKIFEISVSDDGMLLTLDDMKFTKFNPVPTPPEPSRNFLAGTSWFGDVLFPDAPSFFCEIEFQEDGTYLERSKFGNYRGTYFITGDRFSHLDGVVLSKTSPLPPGGRLTIDGPSGMQLLYRDVFFEISGGTLKIAGQEFTRGGVARPD